MKSFVEKAVFVIALLNLMLYADCEEQEVKEDKSYYLAKGEEIKFACSQTGKIKELEYKGDKKATDTGPTVDISSGKFVCTEEYGKSAEKSKDLQTNTADPNDKKKYAKVFEPFKCKAATSANVLCEVPSDSGEQTVNADKLYYIAKGEKIKFNCNDVNEKIVELIYDAEGKASPTGKKISVKDGEFNCTEQYGKSAEKSNDLQTKDDKKYAKVFEPFKCIAAKTANVLCEVPLGTSNAYALISRSVLYISVGMTVLFAYVVY